MAKPFRRNYDNSNYDQEGRSSNLRSSPRKVNVAGRIDQFKKKLENTITMDDQVFYGMLDDALEEACRESMTKEVKRDIIEPLDESQANLKLPQIGQCLTPTYQE